MRIAIITSQFPALSETFVSNKIKRLAARGHEIKIFTRIKDDALFNQLFESSTTISVTEFTFSGALLYVVAHPVKWLKCITLKIRKRDLFNAYRLQAINKFKPDIIHFEFSGVGVEYLPLLNKVYCKKVVSCRGSAEKIKLLASPERKKHFIQLMQAVDGVHCVSSDMCNTIKTYVDANKIFINYPSVDTHFFDRTTSYYFNTVPIIISVGRFIFQKNYLFGLLALQHLANMGIAFKWKIVASGPQYEEIVFHIHQLQLQNFVELVGNKTGSEIKTILEEADIYLLTSVYEGVANAALEAMSMQLPVVSTTSGGMSEVITCGKNGLLAGVYDYKKIAEHILYLINHPHRAKEIGISARERILEQFSLQQQTDKFENIYQQLLTA